MSGSTYCGSCLCGEVEYEIAPPFLFFQYCHCSRCRKVTGSAHGSNLLLRQEQFRWKRGAERVQQWAVPETKHFCTAFCQQCGSNLPWLTRDGQRYLVPVGTLNDALPYEPERNIFHASAANWYKNVTDLPSFDTLPARKR